MPSLPTKRFLALDVFRGMTICFMIIVNTPGDDSVTFSPLLHARWHGFTPTDLVFPSFLFAVGNAMSFVMQKWAGLGDAQVVGKILKRTIIIFLCGYLMYWFPFFRPDATGHWALKPIETTRIFGVLQRIALCYCFASLMIWFFKPRATLIISVFILIGYRLVLMWFGEPGNQLGITGNAGTKLDLWLMGPKHLYHGEGIPFDPEGVLSTFPAIANVVGGYLVGRFIQQKGRTWEMLSKLLLAGFILITIAYFWDLSFPINKKLWSSSFVLYTVGLDCVILSAAMYVIDFLNKTRWTYFFEVFGKNPLFIYLLSELLVTVLFMIHVGSDGQSLFRWIYADIFSYAGPYWGSLFFALAYMLLCWSVGYFLDKKRIYVRV
jgi:predicted acyltransferase